MSTAPPHTRNVPQKENLVKGSPSINVAYIELKTIPDYAILSIDTGHGKWATSAWTDIQLATSKGPVTEGS